MSESEFLTTEQRCDYLRVNERTVYRLRQAGRIPALRIGRLWRYRKSDIDAQESSANSGRRGDGRRGA